MRIKCLPFKNIKGYGHEDTLFGYDLMKQRIPITHTDNPILVKDYDTNEEFIKKTERAIQNLNTVLEITDYNIKLINSIKLLRTLQKNTFLQFTSIKRLSSIFIPILKKICSIGFMPLIFFDLLKLCFAIKYIKIQKT